MLLQYTGRVGKSHDHNMEWVMHKSARIFRVIFLSVHTIMSSCLAGEPAGTNDYFAIIANPKAESSKVIEALVALQASKQTNEPAIFWSKIANDAAFSDEHRKRAVLQLFARHFTNGMTIQELATVLNHPTWLRRADVKPFGSGDHPAFGKDSDEWCWINIFGNRVNQAAIWLRFERGKSPPPDELYQTLADDTKDTEVRNIKILGIAEGEVLANYRIRYNLFGVPPSATVHN
jgi:hypothetical protein